MVQDLYRCKWQYHCDHTMLALKWPLDVYYNLHEAM